MQREQKRIVGIVRVEQVERTEIEGVVAGDGGEKCVQEVVFFFIELGIVNTEDFVKIRARAIDFRQIQVVDDDGQREFAKIISVQLDLLDSFAEFADLRFLGIVDEDVLGVAASFEVDLAYERTLRVVEVPPSGLDRSGASCRVFLLPLGDNVDSSLRLRAGA